MKINQLRYFAAIVDHGSLRKASEALSISQPALSQSMKKLEELFQCPLFERSATGIVPTAYGKVVYGFFNSAAESIGRAQIELDLLKKGSKGHLAIGAPTGLIDLVLPEIIEGLAADERGYTFNVTYGYFDELLAHLRSGRVDYLLALYWPDDALADDLVIEKLADIRLSIYGRAQHPLVRKRTVTREDLSKARWILPESKGMRSFLTGLFGSDYQGSIERPIVHDYPPFMIGMLERLDLLSLIPDYTVSHNVEQGKLKRIVYPEFKGVMPAGLIHRKGRFQTPAMAKLCAITREVVARRFPQAPAKAAGR
jgi:LysR family pca operon transcriptional activator